MVGSLSGLFPKTAALFHLSSGSSELAATMPGCFSSETEALGYWEKSVRIEGTAAQPEQPEGFQDLALAVQSRVAHSWCAPGWLGKNS